MNAIRALAKHAGRQIDLDSLAKGYEAAKIPRILPEDETIVQIWEQVLETGPARLGLGLWDIGNLWLAPPRGLSLRYVSVGGWRERPCEGSGKYQDGRSRGVASVAGMGGEV